MAILATSARGRALALAVLYLLVLLFVASSPSHAAKVDWRTQAFDVQRTGYNPSETTIGVGNAGGLHMIWSLPLSSYTICSPAVAADVLVNGTPTDIAYTGSEHGDFYAVNAVTGAIVWQRNLGSEVTSCPQIPDRTFGVSSSPAIDRASNRVYVVGGDGKVYAMDLATGAIASGWPVPITSDPLHEHAWGAVTLSGNTLYATLSSVCDFTPYHGRVMAIDIPTATRTTFFVPANRTTNGGGIWGYGGVSIEPGGSDVYTATGNAVGSPENFRYCENVVRLTSSLGVVAANYPGLTGFDVDFGSTPVLFQPPGCNQLLAAENKNGELMIYDRNAIASGPLQRVQCSASNNTFIGDVAYSAATNLMYVSNSTDSPNGQYPHGLLAFAVQGCRLQLAWQKTVGVNGTTPPPPAVANGVVYWGSGSGSQLFAFDASSGTQLWSSGSTISGGIYEAPVVVNGRVYVGGWDKKLYCFAP